MKPMNVYLKLCSRLRKVKGNALETPVQGNMAPKAWSCELWRGKLSLPHIIGIGEREINNQGEVCRPCRLGKATRNPRKAIGMCRNKETRTIERVYTDVVGPMTTALLCGAKYFVTLIEEYSGYSMVRVMKNKVETKGFVREMILEAENVFNGTIGTLYLKVKWLWSDEGVEYIAGTCIEWLRACGTIH